MMLAICLWIKKKRMVEDIEFESIRVAPARFKRTVSTHFTTGVYKSLGNYLIKMAPRPGLEPGTNRLFTNIF